MLSILAVHIIPILKKVFFIVHETLLHNKNELLQMLGREYIEEILLSKHEVTPIELKHWLVEVVTEKNFYELLKQNNPTKELELKRPSIQPNSLELFTINILKAPSFLSENYSNTTKVLSDLSGEDVIEIFI